MVAALATDPTALRSQLDTWKTEDLELLRWKLAWKAQARSKQYAFDKRLSTGAAWDFYGIMSGRGFGKTLSAANWTAISAASDPGSYNFVVAPTHDDLIKVCFYGPTGLHAVLPRRLIRFATKSPPVIRLYNDAQIFGFAADTPERLRGPQCNRAWCDEIASWRYPDAAWDNLIMGMRLGAHPQAIWTGTPKPKPFLRALIKLARSIVVTGSTYENRENLPDTLFENVAKYEGTKIGRQELYGEIIDPEEAGFVKRSDWRLWPASKPLPKFRFIIMSLDTALTEKTWHKKEQTGDPTACSVWGVFEYEKLDNVMLLDAWEEHLGFPELVRRVKSEKEFTYGDADEPLIKPVVGQMRARHQGRAPDLILIEDKGSGISLRQQLAVENIFTEVYNPGNLDKLSRLHACSPMFPARRVWAVESNTRTGEPRSWAEPLIAQVCTYVGEGSLEHDDLLDTSTQALLYIMHRFRLKFTARTDPDATVRAALDSLKRKERKNPYGG